MVKATNIVEDCIFNIIHDTVLQVHREEKILRMQSAATVVSEQAASLQPNTNPVQPTKGSPPLPSFGRVETSAAVYDNGKVYLTGNPLKTTPEIICSHCKLPRLLYPISGIGSQTPDMTKQYCTKHPFVTKPGHDIYGNPFPTDVAKTKKERELLKAQARADKDSTPASQDTRGTATPPDGATGNKENNTNAIASTILKLTAPTKPASYIPWHTCPNCKRSLLITRFAQHLEKCLGISGRASSRNALAKIAAGTGSNNTPLGSRGATPVAGNGVNGSGNGMKNSPVKRFNRDGDEDGADDRDDIPLKKKVKKKSNYIKKADRERLEKEGVLPPGSSTIKGKLTAPMKRLPKTGLAAINGEKANESGKRSREDDDNDSRPAITDQPKKKLKLNLSGDGSKSKNAS